MSRRKVKPPKKLKQRSRAIPMSPELVEHMEAMRKQFVEKFGREPGPDDPIFFDPDADTPAFLSPAKMKADWERICEAGIKANLDRAVIYAMAKTGRMLTQENQKHLDPQEIEEWGDAVAQFREHVSEEQARNMTWPEIKQMVEDSHAAQERDAPERLMDMAMYALHACVNKEIVHVQDAFTGGPDGMLGLVTCYVTCPDAVAHEIQDAVQSLVAEILARNGLEPIAPPKVN